MSEYFWREVFQAGLQEELQISLACFPHNDSVIFERFMLYVQGCENQLKVTREAEKWITNYDQDSDKGSNSCGGRSSNQPNSKDSSQSTSNDKPKNNPSSGYKQKATYTDKCFTCYQTGHKLFDCPLVKDKNTNKSKN